jgi:hypothetical protein
MARANYKLFAVVSRLVYNSVESSLVVGWHIAATMAPVCPTTEGINRRYFCQSMPVRCTFGGVSLAHIQRNLRLLHYEGDADG